MKFIRNIAFIIISISCLISSMEYIDNDDVKIFPNPADTYFQIDTSTNLPKVKRVSIYNIVGNKILDQNFSGQRSEQINVSKLNAGKYFVRINLADQSQVTKHLIIK